MAIAELKPKSPTIVEPERGQKSVIKVHPPQEDYEEKKTIILNRIIIWFVLIIIEFLLALRFTIKLFGANPDSLFSITIMFLSSPLMFFFRELFDPYISPSGNVIIEWSALFAMIVYAIAALIGSLFFRIRKPIDPKEAENKAEETIP